MVSDGCRQHSEVLQGGLDGLVDGSLAVVGGTVAVGGAEGLQLGQVAVEVLVAHLLGRDDTIRARGVRYSHVLQQSDHVVAQGLVVLVQVVITL